MRRNKFKKSGKLNKNEFFKEETGILIKSENSDDYYFEGIASSYENVDSYGDVFLEGSLDHNLGKTVPIMPNHSWDILKAIGSGVMKKEGKKILISGNFLKNDIIAEKIVSLKNSGVPIKLSIGGIIEESKPYKKDGVNYRGIAKASIYEVSVVFRGANPNATITKGLENLEEEQMEEILKELQLMKEQIAKAGTEVEKNTLTKAMADIAAKMEKMNVGLTEEEKAEIVKKEKEAEERIKKLEENIDKLTKNGPATIENEEAELKKYEQEVNEFLKKDVIGETIKKTLSTATGSGAALIPTSRIKEIIKEVVETSVIYEKCRVYTTSTNKLELQIKKPKTNNAAGQAEGANPGAASEGGYLPFELKVGKITDWQSVTQELLDDSDFNVMAEMLEDSKENIAEIIAENIWNGVAGVKENQFEGIYKNTTVTNAAIEGTLTWENMNKMVYDLPKKVRIKSEFIVSTEALIEIMNWKDSLGRPLYTASTVVGEPGKLVGYSITEDPFMDSVLTGKFPVFFGSVKDFYARLMNKNITIEKSRVAGDDNWKIYIRTRQGGKVRQASHGRLLKIGTDPSSLKSQK